MSTSDRHSFPSNLDCVDDNALVLLTQSSDLFQASKDLEGKVTDAQEVDDRDN